MLLVLLLSEAFMVLQVKGRVSQEAEAWGITGIFTPPVQSAGILKPVFVQVTTRETAEPQAHPLLANGTDGQVIWVGRVNLIVWFPVDPVFHTFDTITGICESVFTCKFGTGCHTEAMRSGTLQATYGCIRISLLHVYTQVDQVQNSQLTQNHKSQGVEVVVLLKLFPALIILEIVEYQADWYHAQALHPRYLKESIVLDQVSYTQAVTVGVVE